MRALIAAFLTFLLVPSVMGQMKMVDLMDYAPTSWFILGPFPNEEAEVGQPRPGLDRDYLEAIGGEPNAQLTDQTTVAYEQHTARVQSAYPDENGIIDLVKVYKTDTDFKVAYAYAQITVGEPTTYHASFGSDDAAAVWVNGLRVHRVETPGRMVDVESDHFEVPLNTGRNRILIKIENGGGGWGFALRLLDDAGEAQRQHIVQMRHLEAFDPGPDSGSFLLGDQFPRIVWRRSDASAAFLDGDPAVQWYGPDLNPASRPGPYGRYVAVIEADTTDGHTHRRMLTFARVPEGTVPPFFGGALGSMPEVSIPWDKLGPSAPSAPVQREVSRHMWAGLGDYFARSEGGAIAAAAIAEMNAEGQSTSIPDWLNTGFIRNAEHQLALRMKLENRTPRPLAAVEVIPEPAPELRIGTETEAGLKPGTVENLRALCNKWNKDDPNGFVVLVARRGVIVMHEGFGGYATDTTFAPASIGKAIAGLTIGRAIDQGLIDLDQPVGDILPDWSNAHTRDVTFRYLFTHLNGLRGHASHGGLFNAYLDNALFIQDAIYARPGVARFYNGDGYDLAGKALELTTGQSMWRILHETMQKPFDEPVSQYDLGFGDQFNAMYLGKVGQMILQDGAYGEHRFFSPGFLNRLYPTPLAPYVPMLEDNTLEWGVGFEWMIDPPGARAEGVLGPNVLGHGSATASVWRIAPDHDLVVVIGRNQFKDWGGTANWAGKFMTILAEGLEP